jgi:hypothetical protein
VEISSEFGSFAIPSVKGILNLHFLASFYMPVLVKIFDERFLTRLIYRRPQSHLKYLRTCQNQTPLVFYEHFFRYETTTVLVIVLDHKYVKVVTVTLGLA